MTARSARLETLGPKIRKQIRPRQAYNGSATPPGTEGQEAADLRAHESAVYVARSVAIWGEVPFISQLLEYHAFTTLWAHLRQSRPVFLSQG